MTVELKNNKTGKVEIIKEFMSLDAEGKFIKDFNDEKIFKGYSLRRVK